MNAKHMEEKRKSSNITKFILFILICVFIYSSIQVGNWIISNIELIKLENGLYNEVAVDNKDSGTTQIDFEKLKAINNDVIGWIKIDNTNIDYPILKGETDEYYLRRDIYKNYSFSGSIFYNLHIQPNIADFWFFTFSFAENRKIFTYYFDTSYRKLYLILFHKVK